MCPASFLVWPFPSEIELNRSQNNYYTYWFYIGYKAARVRQLKSCIIIIMDFELFAFF